MCGIAGLAGFPDSESTELPVRAMIDAIAHRGPDGQGVEAWPGTVLAHRRLAILDLSEAGAQPMLSRDRRVGVVFNGCIYNFVELRKKLEAAGRRFRSNCDTEVLVEGYQEWGIDGLVPQLRGMFAFAVWDDARRTLTLVRDRLGVKPLLYSTQNGRIGFASTLTALRKAGFGGDLDAAAVLEFLEFGYVTDERTMYEGISKLPAATILEWTDGRVSQRRYWRLPDIDENSRITFDEAVEETERILVESVRLRLVSDVPVGALLSGGIDSTLVCWAIKKLNANLTTFTVATPGDPEDEAPQTVETARVLGLPHKIVTLPREQAGVLDQLTAAYGEPFGAQSATAMLGVSAAVKEHATVLLTGDGGDDVFLGYSFHHACLRTQHAARRMPEFAAPLWRVASPAFHRLPGMRRPARYLDYITGGLGAMTRAHDGLPFYDARGMRGPRLAGLELPHRQIPLSFRAARSVMSEFLTYQQRMWFVAEFMTKVDGATMFHALEARAPLLDHTLWEFAAKLPAELRLRGGTLKAILREIVRRRVGPEIATRKKRGFSIPVERWLLTHWDDALTNMVQEPALERGGWIRPGALEAVIREEREKRREPRQLWFLVVLENWLRKHAGDATAAQQLSAASHGRSFRS